MKNLRRNICTSLLMLITFVAQAVASVSMPCLHADMSTMKHSSNSELKMNHAGMMSEGITKHNIELTSQNTMMDCCQEQCQCPMSGCVSLFIQVSNTFSSAVITEQQIAQLPSFVISPINSSLYRPPIS